MLDERKSIRKVAENANREVLADLFSEFIGQTYFFKSFPDKVAGYSFVKDPVFDLLKTRLSEGLAFIFEKMEHGVFRKRDLRIVADYIKFQCKRAYGEAVLYVRKAIPLFVDFSAKYSTARNTMEQLQAAPLSAEKFRKLVILFPNDINATYNIKMADLMEAMQTDELAVWEKVDFEYFRNTYSNAFDAAVKEDLQRSFNILEHHKDVLIINASENVEKYEAFIAKYPNDPLRMQVEEAIVIYRENEALRKAIDAGNKERLERFLEDYPNSRWREKVQTYLRETDFEVIQRGGRVVMDFPIVRPTPIIRPPKPSQSFFGKVLRVLKAVR